MRAFRTIALPAAVAAGLMAAPALAQDDSPLASFEVMTPDFALDLAEAVLAACRAEDFQVAVAVVDRFGLAQVMIRDRYAGAHTVDTAMAKAWTAASFRERTLELERMIGEGTLSPGLGHAPGALMLGGGVPVTAAGAIVGAVGVSGAPGPDLDDSCAQSGLDDVGAALDF